MQRGGIRGGYRGRGNFRGRFPNNNFRHKPYNANKGPEVKKQNSDKQSTVVKTVKTTAAPPTKAPAIKASVTKAPNLTDVKIPTIKSQSPKIEISKQQPAMLRNCRMYVGGFPLTYTEDQARKLFSEYGTLTDMFYNKEKCFAFIKMKTREEAEKFKQAINGHVIAGRTLRVRNSTQATVLVKNFSNTVTNELLKNAFEQFGAVERAVVICDSKGRSTCKGTVDFARKSSALKAVTQCNEGCFFVTRQPKPVSAEMYEAEDEEDGLLDKIVVKNNFYHMDREMEPRFAKIGSVEEQYARRWKALYNLEKEQREQLERNIQNERTQLESEMENFERDHKSMMLKEELLRKQQELQKLEEEKLNEIARRRQNDLMRIEQHNADMEERKRRQALLRAQVDGLYRGPPPPVSQPPPQITNVDFRAFDNQPQMFTNSKIEPTTGGLAPAPSRLEQAQRQLQMQQQLSNTINAADYYRNQVQNYDRINPNLRNVQEEPKRRY